MKDLYRCLDSHPIELLQGIAQVWEIPLTAERKRDLVEELARGMLDDDACQAVVQSLSSAAVEILADILRQEGLIPSSRLAVAYGAIRPLGPARVRRERPWEHPENPLEELFYRGLIFRDFDQVEGRHVKVFVTPEQLESLPPIKALHGRGVLESYSQTDSLSPQKQGFSCVEDCLAVLAGIRRFPFEESSQELEADSDWLAVLVPSSRALGPWPPARRAFLKRMLIDLGVVAKDKLRLTLRARTFLRSTRFRCLQNLLVTWRDDTSHDELFFLKELIPEKVGDTHDRVTARRRVLDLLAALETDVWYGLDPFIKFVKRHNSDYLRPDGDLQQWYVRERESGDYLEGVSSWDPIEGRLLGYLLCQPLYWLGIIELGHGTQQEVCAFRVTPLGAKLIAASRQGPLPLSQRHDPETALATIDVDIVSVPVSDTLYERYQLERFALWLKQGDAAHYQITAQSFWRGLRAGIQKHQIVRFLSRLADGQLPKKLITRIEEWGDAFGHARAQCVMLVRSDDETTIDRIQKDAKAGPLISAVIGPRTCLVRERDALSFKQRLAEMGIWLQWDG